MICNRDIVVHLAAVSFFCSFFLPCKPVDLNVRKIYLRQQPHRTNNYLENMMLANDISQLLCIKINLTNHSQSENEPSLTKPSLIASKDIVVKHLDPLTNGDASREKTTHCFGSL